MIISHGLYRHSKDFARSIQLFSSKRSKRPHNRPRSKLYRLPRVLRTISRTLAGLLALSLNLILDSTRHYESLAHGQLLFLLSVSLRLFNVQGATSGITPVYVPEPNAVAFADQITIQRAGTNRAFLQRFLHTTLALLDASITGAPTRQTTGTTIYGLLTRALSHSLND